MHKLKHEFKQLVQDELVTITKVDDDLFKFEYPSKDEIYGDDLPNRVVMERITALEVLEAQFARELDDIQEMLKEMNKLND